MDAALALLLVFLVYSVLLGVCLARMKAINREFADIKQVVATLGTIQRDTSNVPSVNAETLQAINEILAAKSNG